MAPPIRRTREARIWGLAAAVVCILGAVTAGTPAASATSAASSTSVTSVTSATSASAASAASGWTVYHGSPSGSGVASSVTAVDTSRRAWTSPVLSGQLYGEPLVAGGRVYVATEDNVVYALSATTGAVVWSTRLAQPVPSSALPCGDIQPTVGVTGTPVIDPGRGELFVVADELVAGRPAHTLVGLDLDTGRTELSEDVDPPGASPAALLERTGLTLDAGQVLFGFGGNYGDCASYRGRVVAVPESGGTPLYFTVDGAAGQSQGAVWMGGGAPAVDAAGNVWVEAGNGSVYSASHAYDDSDSVLELSPSLHLEQYFAPSSWPSNNAHDLDMSMVPALLADGQVLVAGKSRIGYLVNGSDLGGIGGQQATEALPCNEDIDGGIATVGTTVYLPCLTGIMAVGVTASPASLRVLWSSGRGGGPPVVAAGLVWTVGQDGVLYGLDPTTGAVRQQATIGVPANHFPTPGVGDGLFLVTTADQVVALSAPSGGATPTAQPATSQPATTTQPTTPVPAVDTGGSIPPGGIAAIVVGSLAVIAALVWGWRRRRGRPQTGRG
jgi:outer membrane protein assembly factor BamB